MRELLRTVKRSLIWDDYWVIALVLLGTLATSLSCARAPRRPAGS